MKSISYDDNAKMLIVHGVARKADKDGIYELGEEELKSRDLSSLPPGIRIKLRYRADCGILSIRDLTVLADGKVDVTIDYSEDENPFWEHIIDDKVNRQIVLKLIEGSGHTIDDETEETHLEVDTGTWEDIQRNVDSSLRKILQPLLEFREQMEKIAKEKFGI